MTIDYLFSINHSHDDSTVETFYERASADDEKIRLSDPTPFINPVTEGDREEMRWYLEEYIRHPLGGDSERAGSVTERMEEIGYELFQLILGNEDAKKLYKQAAHKGLEDIEITVNSSDPEFLALPWELIRDPEARQSGPLALGLGALYRRINREQCIELPTHPKDQPMRVLFVLARPDGKDDVPCGMIARPVLEAIRPLRPSIDVEVLRAPTFANLQKKLNEIPGFYQIVHFDGHGLFVPDDAKINKDDPKSRYMEAGEGHLVFEDDEGKAMPVSSKRLGETLSGSKVPLFILNACQSDVSGDKAYSSTAAGLLRTGALGVVAMNHSVIAHTAAGFISALYGALIKNATLTGAVTTARRAIATDTTHELEDWSVPTLYTTNSSYMPMPEGAGSEVKADESLMADLDMVRKVCPPGRYGFIGRDAEILEIERALYDAKRPWALLSGIGGTGKSDLANGFARWYAETGGAPGRICRTSFEYKSSMAHLIGTIVGHGSELSKLPEEEQLKRVTDFLRKTPCLLVWDNYETVSGIQEGIEPLSSIDDQKRLSDFLLSLAGGKSRVIITSRKVNEVSLEIDYKAIKVGGLNQGDSEEMAAVIIDRIPGFSLDKVMNKEAYIKLLKYLNGHARSLEMVIPQLQKKIPTEVHESILARSGGDMGKKMVATLSVAYDSLSDNTKKHLPIVGLFASFVSTGLLEAFSAQFEGYETIVGKPLSAEEWEAILDEASNAGILEHYHGNIYQLHPTMPIFFRSVLDSSPEENALAHLDRAYMGLYAAWTYAIYEELAKANQNIIAALSLEENNLLRSLKLAINGEQWEAAQGIATALYEFYNIRGRLDEWRTVRAGLLEKTGRKVEPEAQVQLASLWQFLLGNEANDLLNQNRLDDAEARYREILSYNESLNDPKAEPIIAVSYHQLGMVFEEKREYKEAVGWYEQAIEINERLGLKESVAANYHQIGRVHEEQKKLDEAERWYKKALEIYERLKLERNASDGYHQLGIIYQLRGNTQEATKWFKKAVEIKERLGLEGDAAKGYHHLGMLFEFKGDLDRAERWYRKSLEICERLKLDRESSAEYHHLGNIACRRSRFGEAEAWFNKAISICQRYNDWTNLATTLAQLGVVQVQAKKVSEAIYSLGVALSLASQHKMQEGRQMLTDITRIMDQLGEEEFINTWKKVHQETLPPPPLELLRDYLKKIKAEEEREEE